MFISFVPLAMIPTTCPHPFFLLPLPFLMVNMFGWLVTPESKAKRLQKTSGREFVRSIRKKRIEAASKDYLVRLLIMTVSSSDCSWEHMFWDYLIFYTNYSLNVSKQRQSLPTILIIFVLGAEASIGYYCLLHLQKQQLAGERRTQGQAQ